MLFLKLIIFFPFSALAQTPSNSIPTAQLQVSFVVDVANGANQVDLQAELFRTANGQLVEELAISPNDLITFSAEGGSVTFDPVHPENNKLPYRAGTTYMVSFTRANGETFSSTATIAAPISISSPAARSEFKRTEAVLISWTEAPYNIKTSSLTSKCLDVRGTILYTSNTGLVPAGYTAYCQTGPISEHFVQVYAIKGTPMRGLRGSFMSSTSADLFFSFGPTLLPEIIPPHSNNIPRLLMEAERMNLREVHFEN